MDEPSLDALREQLRQVRKQIDAAYCPLPSLCQREQALVLAIVERLRTAAKALSN